MICPGVGRVSTILTQGASFRARLRHQPKVVYRPAWSRRWWASLSVRGERATTGLRRALSEAGEGTVLARPETQLSGRARAVVLVANDEAKRPSGSPPRHLSMPSMNSTSRVRPVHSIPGWLTPSSFFLPFFLPSFLPVPAVTLVVTTSWLSSVSSSGAIGHSGGTRKGGSCGNRAFTSDCSASRRIQTALRLASFLPVAFPTTRKPQLAVPDLLLMLM